MAAEVIGEAEGVDICGGVGGAASNLERLRFVVLVVVGVEVEGSAEGASHFEDVGGCVGGPHLLDLGVEGGGSHFDVGGGGGGGADVGAEGGVSHLDRFAEGAAVWLGGGGVSHFDL